jgi:hypothetical protein
MPLVDFTSHDAIRAALGVSKDEIEDATISLPLYEDNLAAELDEIDLALATEFATVKALASPTDVQTRFLRSARLFATYVVAKHLTSALPMFAPKEITDGKSSLSRFVNPYKDTIDEVNRQYEVNRTRLEDAYAGLSSGTAPTVAPMPYLTVSAPAFDPVTGV